MTAQTQTKTRELVRAMTAMYRRVDTGANTGRNAGATFASLSAKWEKLQAELVAGGFEELDASPRLAASYARLERRHLLGTRGQS